MLQGLAKIGAFDDPMSSLRIDEIKQDGSSVELGRVNPGQCYIGREPEAGGVAINNSAISRNHGVFAWVRDNWIYKDLGSTNGSWLNGTKLKGNEWRLVRSGNTLQLANTPIRLTVSSSAAAQDQSAAGTGSIGGRSLLVFIGDDFVDEFPISEYGRSLVVGGTGADLPLDGDTMDLPSLVFERRGGNVCCYSMTKTGGAAVNGRIFGGDVENLSDGDAVQISKYLVLFNDPASSTESGADRQAASSLIKDWGEDRPSGILAGAEQGSVASDRPGPTHTGRFTFGQAGTQPAEVEETVALTSDQMAKRGLGRDVHPSMRYVQERQQGSFLETMEEQIFLIVGVVILGVFLLIGVWWFFLL